MLEVKFLIAIFLLSSSHNLISQKNINNYSVTTQIYTSYGCNLFVLYENNAPIDSFYCVPDRHLVLRDYFVPSKDTILIIYSHYAGVSYENFILKDEKWTRSYSSGLIYHTPKPGVWVEEIFGPLNGRNNINEIDFIIEGIDSVKIIQEGKVTYVNFEKKIQDRINWLKEMEKRKNEHLLDR